MIQSSVHPTALRAGDVFALPKTVGLFEKRPAVEWVTFVGIDLLRDGYQLHYVRAAGERQGESGVVSVKTNASLVLRRPTAVHRIAFAGASGTGKTTRATAVAKALGLPLCPVGSRSVAEAMGYDSPYDVDRAGQRAAFQARLLLEKRVWEKDHEGTGFVTDRTHYDNLAYTTMHCPEALSSALIGDVVRFSEIYTTIVFCPMGTFWDVGKDSARVPQQGYHEMFEILVEGMIRRFAQTETGHGPLFVARKADPQWLLGVMGWDKVEGSAP